MPTCTFPEAILTLVVAVIADLHFKGCVSNVRLRSYHHGPFDPSRQYLLSRLLTTYHMDIFQSTAGQREVLGT